ncbi:hypothetical protein NL676_013464 [Syzygium grande]|nr:hypothetical protein NL676_013464 [Syzygium grande]
MWQLLICLIFLSVHGRAIPRRGSTGSVPATAAVGGDAGGAGGQGDVQQPSRRVRCSGHSSPGGGDLGDAEGA